MSLAIYSAVHSKIIKFREQAMNTTSVESIAIETNKAARAKPNKRSWVSISLVAALLGMIITGIMSYALPYSEFIAGVHTWFAIGFIVLMVFHLRNNFKAIFNYIKQPWKLLQ